MANVPLIIQVEVKNIQSTDLGAMKTWGEGAQQV